jgi:hypothetical protein
MPSRLWLDATKPDDPNIMHDESKSPAAANVSSMPVAPVIPQRRSPALSSRAVSDSRRHALTLPKPRRRLDRDRQSDPPVEVISNLIDSFSTISLPEDENEKQKEKEKELDARAVRKNRRRGFVSADTSPVVRHVSSFDGDTGRRLVGDYSAYRDAVAEEFAHIDDAAEPPIVRTSKPPSGFSALTAPKKKDHSSHRPYWPGSLAGQSSSSLYSIGSEDDVRSVGTVSIERRTSIGRARRESLDGPKSPRKLQKPGHSKSRSRSNEVNGLDTAGTSEVVEYLYMSQASTRPSSVLNSPIIEEVPDEQSLNLVESKREGKRPVKDPNMGAPNLVIGPPVPSRRSSLRIQDVPTPGPRRSSRSSLSGLNLTKTVTEEEEPKVLTSFDILNGEDTQVTKRIRELKAKKELRDRELRESPTSDFEAEGFASAALDATPNQPGSVVGTMTSSAKSRKAPHLSDIQVPPAGPVPNATPKAKHLAVQQDEPSSPLTPTRLPINYSFVLQSLDNDRPPSPSSTSKLSAISSRSKSLALGGRSAPGRAAASQSLATKESKDDLFLNTTTTPLKDSETLSLYSEAPGKGKTLTKPRRSSSSAGKKKRWSHPEPAVNGESKRNSFKGTDAPMPRHLTFPDPVSEERTSSKDDIQIKVDSFIHAQRLSHKIRHPQTGRVISFSEVGDPKGNAVFCCVGMGLTRFVTAFYDELALTLGLRLITPDRPGVGESQADPNGTPLSWAGKLIDFLEKSGMFPC